MKINAIDKNGRIVEYEAIMTYHSEEYNKIKTEINKVLLAMKN